MRHILIIIFLVSTTLAFAQARFSNNSSLIPTSKELYLFVENYIKIEGINNSAKNQRISVSHGRAEKIEDRGYRIWVTSEKEDTVMFFINNKLVISEVFSVKKVPYPIARLSNSLDTVLTPAHIFLNPFVSVIIPGCNFRHNAKVMSFLASFIASNGDTNAELSQNDFLLSENQIKEIKKLKAGDKIHFSDIRYTTPDGRTMPLEPFTITIK